MATRNQELIKLTEALNRLEINQAKLARQQYILSKEVKETRKRIEKLDNQKQNTIKEEVVPGSSLYIGDKVRITNPKPGQDDKGEVCGATINGLIKLKSETEAVIRRLPKNLKKLTSEK